MGVNSKQVMLDLDIFNFNWGKMKNMFLGSFQTPNPHIPPYNKYVTYLTTYVGCIIVQAHGHDSCA